MRPRLRELAPMARSNQDEVPCNLEPVFRPFLANFGNEILNPFYLGLVHYRFLQQYVEIVGVLQQLYYDNLSK